MASNNVSASGSPVASRPRLGFLSLPAELRNKVYELALVTDKTITPWENTTQVSAQFLCTNKQIHQEGRDYLYGANFFALDAPSGEALRAFLEQIGPDNAARIEGIKIRTPRVKVDTEEEGEMEQVDITALDMIREKCLALKTLHLTAFKLTTEEKVGTHPRPAAVNRKMSIKAAAVINIRLGDIASRAKIILETCDRCHMIPFLQLKFHEPYGWTSVPVICERCTLGDPPLPRPPQQVLPPPSSSPLQEAVHALTAVTHANNAEVLEAVSILPPFGPGFLHAGTQAQLMMAAMQIASADIYLSSRPTPVHFPDDMDTIDVMELLNNANNANNTNNATPLDPAEYVDFSHQFL
ncbi:hypothetical protein PDE_06481 [Penicillium oxalicum 114-2]|uniref:Uncharacterized protein n=1 Tax=Penicillium oxalicum (strain 114-2 / CGMCC 5302) TaxID=933388 RepID=S7ZS41_PENO1|nr:hypothetical protein PDE_06481 [Penicillium oxalicum 114-2]